MFSVHTTPEEFENGGFTLKTHQMFSVHSTPEKFQSGGFTLKTHQMFSVLTTPEEFENNNHRSFWQGNHCPDAIAFEKLRFQNVFHPH